MRDRYASLREGLVGAWIPSVSGSGLLLPDLSGNGNNGTLTNMGPEDWVAGEHGRALDFDTVNDVIRADNFAPLHLQMTKGTISAWMNITSLGAVHGIYTANNSESVSRFEILYDSRGGFRRFIVLVTSDFSALLNWRPNAILSGWTHVSVMQSGSTISLYLNGVFVTSTSSSVWANDQATAANLPTKVGIGGHNTIGQPLRGQLDDIRIYNRVLSEPEIKLLASRPGIGLRPQRRTMYYAPPTGARRRRILTSMP